MVKNWTQQNRIKIYIYINHSLSADISSVSLLEAFRQKVRWSGTTSGSQIWGTIDRQDWLLYIFPCPVAKSIWWFSWRRVLVLFVGFWGLAIEANFRIFDFSFPCPRSFCPWWSCCEIGLLLDTGRVISCCFCCCSCCCSCCCWWWRWWWWCWWWRWWWWLLLGGWLSWSYDLVSESFSRELIFWVH